VRRLKIGAQLQTFLYAMAPLKITLLNGVSVITNIAISKRDKEHTDK